MDFAARLRDVAAKRGYRQNQLSAISGIAEKTVSRILTGETTNPQIETLRALAGALDVTVGWLLEEKGYELSPDDRGELQRLVTWGTAVLEATRPEKPPSQASNASPVLLSRKPATRAPKRGKVSPASATRWREFFGDRFEDEDVEIPERFARGGADLVFRAEGESMEGEFIAHGDLLYVREESDPRVARGKIVVCVVDGSPYVKRLDFAGDRIRLISANERFPPMVLDEQSVDWSLVGVVVGWLHDVRG